MTRDDNRDAMHSERTRPYLVTPPRRHLPDGFWPPWQAAPDAFDHDHWLDCYVTADGYEVVYCTRCGAQW